MRQIVNIFVSLASSRKINNSRYNGKYLKFIKISKNYIKKNQFLLHRKMELVHVDVKKLRENVYTQSLYQKKMLKNGKFCQISSEC